MSLKICDRNKLNQAYLKVLRNKESSGIDDTKIKNMLEYLKRCTSSELREDEGQKYVVNIALDKYFDRVNHNILINILRDEIKVVI